MLDSFCFYTPCSNRWCCSTNPDWMYQILRKREEDQHPPGDWCQVSWLRSPSAGRSQWSKDPCPSLQTYEWCKWNQYWSHWRMGCWQRHTSCQLEDLNWSFMRHWTKHASWRDRSNQKLTRDLYIVFIFSTAIYLVVLLHCRNYCLSVLIPCNILITVLLCVCTYS